MKNNLRHKLLLLIKHNGRISELIKDGFTYGQVASFINELVEESYIHDEEGKLVLTKKSEDWLLKRTNKKVLRGNELWVLPEEKSRIPKIDRNEVYLPSRNELHF